MAGSAWRRRSLGSKVVMVATMLVAATGAAAQTTRPRMVDLSNDFKSRSARGRIVFEQNERIFHGRVWDSTFRPLDGAAIEVYFRRDVAGSSVVGDDGDPFVLPKPLARAVSAIDGTFRIEIEESDDYVAFAHKDDGHFGVLQFRPIPQLTSIEIFAQYADAIERTLVDADQKAVQDFEIILGQKCLDPSISGGAEYLSRVTTAKDGRIRVPTYLGSNPRRLGPRDFFVVTVDATLYWRLQGSSSAYHASADDLSRSPKFVLPRTRVIDLKVLGAEIAEGTPIEFTIFCRTTPMPDAAPITQYRRFKARIGETVRWDDAPTDGIAEVVVSSPGISPVRSGSAGWKLPDVPEKGGRAAMTIGFDGGTRIRGRLFDRGTMTPVAQVSLRLLPIDDNGHDLSSQRVARTDDDGMFEFENLPRRRFGLAVDSKEFVLIEVRQRGSGSDPNAAESRPFVYEPMLSFIQVDASESIDAIDLWVERSVTLTGRIVDPLGNGFRGLEVAIGRTDGARLAERNWPSFARPMSRRLTYPDGAFKFVGVAANEVCDIAILAADRRPQVVQVRRAEAGGAIDLGDIVLSEPTPPSRLRFVEGDAPIAGVDVILMSGDLPKATDPRMKTDERGEIAFVDRFGAATRAVAILDRPAGLRFEGGRFDIPVQPKSGETEVIRMMRFPVISGSIVRADAAEPEAKFVTAVWLDATSAIDAAFKLLPSEGEAQRLERVRLSSKEAIRSDGTFTIEVPREGRYYLEFSSAPVSFSAEEHRRGGKLIAKVAECFVTNAPVVKTGTSPAIHSLKSIGPRLPLVDLATAPIADIAALAREFPTYVPTEGRR